MDRGQRKVFAFHQLFELPRPSTPTFKEFTQVRVDLIKEEAAELQEAFDNQDMIGAIDALADLLYVVYGASVALGVDIEPFFAEVHSNNMTKVGPDGKPIYREDGKVLKPDTYQPVNLQALFDRMYK